MRHLIIGSLFICLFMFVPAYAQKKAPHVTSKRLQVTYSCPMHPEVTSKSKGKKCPKCGMDLRRPEKQNATAVGETVSSPAVTTASSKMNIPDVELLDQNGKKIHFYTDLVKGQTVVINFIFTTCTTICPPLGATFARVQKELGDKVGRDVRFISISVDPVTDTPERLKAWGAKFHAGEGWTFVTGNKPEIDELLRALGASSASREDHSPTVLIGNEAQGNWTRTYGLANTSTLVNVINDATAGTAAAVGGGEGLVQVVVHNVHACLRGAHPTDVGVHVRTIHIEEGAGIVQDLGDLLYVLLVDAAGVGVGDHERGGGLVHHRPQLLDVHAAVFVQPDLHGPEPGHR
ncbi:MAG TPA: SCO family protein, partial [Pyrinomonadaceae bacterium]|nr:SCO family protein [Pyrinomonadaceae bacterium]